MAASDCSKRGSKGWQAQDSIQGTRSSWSIQVVRTVAIKRQEFLGSVTDVNVDTVIVDAANVKRMSKIGENRLTTAWRPLIVQNVALKGGKLKIQFKAPEVPGRYRLCVP